MTKGSDEDKRFFAIEMRLHKLERSAGMPHIPPPPRLPLPSLDDMGEITEDHGDHIKLTRSEFTTLKSMARAANWGWRRILWPSLAGLGTVIAHVVVKLILK
jgi:hypothetical protein